MINLHRLNNNMKMNENEKTKRLMIGIRAPRGGPKRGCGGRGWNCGT
jgi:hypothetical protein